MQIPTVELLELSEQADLAVRLHGRLDDGDEELVILVMELAAHLEAKNLPGGPVNLLNHRLSLSVLR